MQFLLFFTRPPRRKCNFCCFLLIRRGGNVIFAVFYPSAVAESRFSAFFHFHPWMTGIFLPLFRFHPRITNDFQCFSTFIHGWRAFFASFSLSSTDDEWFSAFFHLHPWMKGIFCLFFIFIHGWRMIFGKSCVSSTDGGRFSAIFAFRRPTTGVFQRF